MSDNSISNNPDNEGPVTIRHRKEVKVLIEPGVRSYQQLTTFSPNILRNSCIMAGLVDSMETEAMDPDDLALILSLEWDEAIQAVERWISTGHRTHSVDDLLFLLACVIQEDTDLLDEWADEAGMTTSEALALAERIAEA